MPACGKLIVLEGIDGSGKRTQIDLLARTFASRGVDLMQISFPRYDGLFGKMVAQFLNGDFGPLEAVDPHFSALLYAGDRFESKPQIEAALAAGKILLADRYIASNLAHQGARMPPRQRPEFLNWLKHVEYGIYSLPCEDLVIYLRVPATAARRLVGKKERRQYTGRRRDLQEANLAHLKTASAVYDELSRQPNWVTIECAEPMREWQPKRGPARSERMGNFPKQLNQEAGSLRPPEAIHAEVLAAIGAKLHIEPIEKHQSYGI
jgi:dTMP kinase